MPDWSLVIPAIVRNKARLAGATAWLDSLPDLVADLAREWQLTDLGAPYDDATEALVLPVTRADGVPAVLKLLVPRDDDSARREVTVLRLDGGRGCVALFCADEQRGALLVERLGRSMSELGLPVERRYDLLCAVASRIWRPAADAGLPTGADKGRCLVDYVTAAWEELDRPSAERTIDHAVACAERRIAAHDDERAVLVHGDVHQWNALEAPGGFKLVDPDGLHAEPEYDLGNIMREDPEELVGTDARGRATNLARRTQLDARAIWEWGVVERVSTGLMCTSVELQPIGREMLMVADEIAATTLDWEQDR